MNLPFGIPNTKIINTKMNEVRSESILKYKKKLDEYRDLLENYKSCMMEYSGKLAGADQRYMENQLSIVQMALDLTYIKEQSDKQLEVIDELTSEQMHKVFDQLQNLTETLIETNCKFDGFDKNIINRFTEVSLELQKQVMLQNKQLQTELGVEVKKLSRSVKTNRVLLWLMIIFNFAGLGAMGYLILYNLDMLPF